MKKTIIIIILIACSAATAYSKKESEFVNEYCKGKIEYRLNNKVRVDCLTGTHSIEFDFAKKWYEAVGQALYYSVLTGKKPGIYLILKKESDIKYYNRLIETIQKKNLNIDVWMIK